MSKRNKRRRQISMRPPPGTHLPQRRAVEARRPTPDPRGIDLPPGETHTPPPKACERRSIRTDTVAAVSGDRDRRRGKIASSCRHVAAAPLYSSPAGANSHLLASDQLSGRGSTYERFTAAIARRMTTPGVLGLVGRQELATAAALSQARRAVQRSGNIVCKIPGGARLGRAASRTTAHHLGIGRQHEVRRLCARAPIRSLGSKRPQSYAMKRGWRPAAPAFPATWHRSRDRR